MKKMVLINWDTKQIEDSGVLHTTANPHTFAYLNEGFRNEGINKVWLIEPDYPAVRIDEEK